MARRVNPVGPGFFIKRTIMSGRAKRVIAIKTKEKWENQSILLTCLLPWWWLHLNLQQKNDDFILLQIGEFAAF